MTDAPLTSGIDRDELNEQVRPQDDLFRHVNGRWIDRTEMPEDKARYGSFMVLAEEAEQAVLDIIEGLANTDDAAGEVSADAADEARKIGDLYASFMNEQRADMLGSTPIAGQLVEVALVDSIPALLKTLGALERQGAPGFAQLFIDNDPGDPERYLVFLEQGGLGLPDESYFRETRFSGIRSAYREHLERMLRLAHLDEPDVRAERIIELETALAGVHWSNVESRDSEKTYNLRAWADVAAASPVDLSIWRDAMGVPDDAFDEIVVRQPSFLVGAGALLTEDRLDQWRDWLAWQVIRASAAYLSSEFVEANFDFYGRTLTGTPQMRERWKRGVSFVEAGMGEAVGRIYVERHFSPTAKTAMDALVENLVEAYRQSIGGLDWMGQATRERALDKLEKFTPKIGFPVKWRDYSSLDITPDDLIANVRAISEFEFQREIGKIGQPLDRDEWHMTPQTINAYYNPGFNEIVFPAAILQYPFFDETRDAAANYGAIGAVIGHEIGHGFDDQGSKYDGDGRLTDWWTEADRDAFEQRTKALIDQFDVLVPEQLVAAESDAGEGDAGESEHRVNGALTIGENIGDLGGLAIAWKAYVISLDGADAPEIDGLSGAQRFFLSWAQAWQQKGRDEEVIRLLAIDPHSPNEFRCNQIVRNIDEFYTGFGVSDADESWLDPADRVTIW